MEGATTRTVLNNFPRNWVSLFMTGPGVAIYKDFFFQFKCVEEYILCSTMLN